MILNCSTSKTFAEWVINVSKGFIATLALLWTLAFPVQADISIVVNPENSVDQIEEHEVKIIFNGGRMVFSDGTPLIMGYSKSNPEFNDEFALATIRHPFAKMCSRWAGKLFAGRLEAPKMFATDSELLNWVQQERGAIAFVPDSLVTDNMKVVHVLKTP